MTKSFSYKTVATVVTGRLFDDLDRVNDMVSYMTGCEITPVNYDRLKYICRSYFLNEYPRLRGMTLEQCSPIYYDCYEADFNDVLGANVPVEPQIAASMVTV